MVITRLSPFSFAKITGILYAILGLVIGAVISLVGVAGGFASTGDSSGATFGALLGVGAIVLLPILYGCVGFVATLIGAALYNLAAGIVGGAEIEVK